MKVIFDFDDVLFNNTKQFKKRMFSCLAKAGIPHDIALEYYKKVREREFSLKDFISHLFVTKKIKGTNVQDVYEDIVSKCKNFVNTELVKIVKKMGKKNCYIITNGDQEFNLEKIKRSGMATSFGQIYVVAGSKKEIIEKICRSNKNEKIIFVDDKNKFLDDLDFKKCPNLKTILYDKRGLVKLKAEIGK